MEILDRKIGSRWVCRGQTEQMRQAGQEMGVKIKREAKKESAKEEFIKKNRSGENYKNVLQITLRLEMIADHKEPVAMETSSLQAKL